MGEIEYWCLHWKIHTLLLSYKILNSVVMLWLGGKDLMKKSEKDTQISYLRGGGEGFGANIYFFGGNTLFCIHNLILGEGKMVILCNQKP